jgi:hypothetical protein
MQNIKIENQILVFSLNGKLPLRVVLLFEKRDVRRFEESEKEEKRLYV